MPFDDKKPLQGQIESEAEPQPAESGVETGQQLGDSIVPEVVSEKEPRFLNSQAGITSEPLLTLLQQVGSGVRAAAIGITQYLIEQNRRKDDEIKQLQERLSERDKQLSEERVARVRAEEQVSRRKVSYTLILFGGFLLGVAGFIYSKEPQLALVLAILDVAMTVLGVLL